MNYEDFIEYVKSNLGDCYRDVMLTERTQNNLSISDSNNLDNIEISVQKVVKNNGIILDAVAIYEEGERISPNIYLKPFYDSYLMGKPLDFVMTEIIFKYRNEKALSDFGNLNLDDYYGIKDKIVIRLINFERNKELLLECPYIQYLDLAITFRYVIDESVLGTASILISNNEFEKWDVNVDELYRQALFNSMQRNPWCMEPLSKIVFDCFDDRFREKLTPDLLKELEGIEQVGLGVNLYIMTNQSKAFGAGCILYDNVISNFAKVQEANIFILPSSVHEVMLVPEDDGVSPEFLLGLLADANRSSVGLIDLLSDNLYYFDRQRDEITIFNA